MATEIKYIYGHYEVYIDGQFYCSADNYSEAYQEKCNLESETTQN